MTLESLHADLTAAATEQVEAFDHFALTAVPGYDRHEHAAATQRAKAAVAAHDRSFEIYRIARDEGLEAAMLFKLSQP